jgi:hypothetical protein
MLGSEGVFHFSVSINLSNQRLRSQDYVVSPVDAECEAMRALLRANLNVADSKMQENNIRLLRDYDPPPHFPIPNDPENARQWREWEQRRKEAGARGRQLLAEQETQTKDLEKRVQELTATLPTLPSIAAFLRSPVALSSRVGSSKTYVLYKGSVWSARKSLQLSEWQSLIEAVLGAEAAKLKAASTSSGSPLLRQIIPAEVRIAVWRRDEGKCARCGSRERLEYDHIIPVALGGSNTERNIELLCEPCNRAKGKSVSLP